MVTTFVNMTWRTIYLVRRPNHSAYASVRVLMIGSSEASMPVVTLVGRYSRLFSIFFVSNALMTAISPSSIVGRLSG